MFIFQKYKSIGLKDVTQILNVLNSLYSLCITGIHNIGKKTYIKEIAEFYPQSIFLENIQDLKSKYNAIYNENFIKQQQSLLYFYFDDKYERDIITLLKNVNKHVHVIVLGSANISMKLSALSYVHRLSVPTFEEKVEQLTWISKKEYGHVNNVKTIAEKYHTYHDCLCAIELYENGIYELYSYEDIINEIVNDFIVCDKMTLLQLRNKLYNLMMHLSDFSEIVLYVVRYLNKYAIDKYKVIQIAANAEYNFLRGNKEVYHYEALFNNLKNVYHNGKKNKVHS